MGDSILSIRNLSKHFAGVLALRDINLDIERGEVHVIVGENGAGKSTLIKIIAGIHTPDDGEVKFDGKVIRNFLPSRSQEMGIATIFQESAVYPDLSVVENVFIQNKITKRVTGLLDWRKMEEVARAVFQELGEDIDMRKDVSLLTVGLRKIVEIARALIQNAKCIIMDEPTSSLSDKEVNKLFEQIKLLKLRGITIIYVTHKLDEVFSIGDKVTVLRDGKLISTCLVREVDKEQLIQMMINRKLDTYYPVIEGCAGEFVLEVDNFTSDSGFFRSIGFRVRRGEIVGLYGLVGSGRSELAHAIYGIDRNYRGSMKIIGRKVNIRSPLDAIRKGIAYLPEDRQNQGLAFKMDVKSNITLAVLNKLLRMGFIDKRKESGVANKTISELKILTPSIYTVLENLSGGNQQKTLVGKWLNSKPTIFIMDEPTRGIDVGTKAEIYQFMKKLISEGVAILLISSELPEIMGMSNRILVMREGSIVAQFDGTKPTREEVMRAALAG